MGELTFKLRDANNQKLAKRVSILGMDNPMVSELATAVSKQISKNVNDRESLRFYNKTRDQALVEGFVKDQIQEDDEIIYSTEGAAGSGIRL